MSCRHGIDNPKHICWILYFVEVAVQAGPISIISIKACSFLLDVHKSKFLRPSDQAIKDVISTFDDATGFLDPEESGPSSSSKPPKAETVRARGRGKPMAPKPAAAKPAHVVKPKRGRGRGS